MKEYIIIGACMGGHKGHHHALQHYDEETARDIVDGIRFTDRQGTEKEGAHWTAEECQQTAANMGLSFPEGTTEWDVYAAFNSFYADTCKVLSETDIIRAAHAFYFDDEDAPALKLQHYMEAMHCKSE